MSKYLTHHMKSAGKVVACDPRVSPFLCASQNTRLRLGLRKLKVILGQHLPNRFHDCITSTFVLFPALIKRLSKKSLA